MVEIVRGSLPYRDKKGNVPNNIILLQNLILNLDTKEIIDKTFPNETIGNRETFSEDTREFVTLCLNRLEHRPKYDGLKATKFYQTYGSKSNEERKETVAKWLNFYGLQNAEG